MRKTSPHGDLANIICCQSLLIFFVVPLYIYIYIPNIPMNKKFKARLIKLCVLEVIYVEIIIPLQPIKCLLRLQGSCWLVSELCNRSGKKWLHSMFPFTQFFRKHLLKSFCSNILCKLLQAHTKKESAISSARLPVHWGQEMMYI